jgi:glucan-binding YG repeat protein
VIEMKTRILNIALISALSLILLAGCSEGTNNHSAAVSPADTTSSSVKKSEKKSESKSSSDKQVAATTSSTPDNSEGTDQSSTAQSTESSQPVANNDTYSAPAASTQSSQQQAAATTSSQPQSSSTSSVASSSSKQAAAESSSTESAVPLAQFYGKWDGADGFTIYYTTTGTMVVTQDGNTTQSPVVAEQMADGRVLFRATKPGINNILAKIINGKMYLTMAGFDSLELTRDTGWNGQLPE